jgi:hypothetical protein
LYLRRGREGGGDGLINRMLTNKVTNIEPRNKSPIILLCTMNQRTSKTEGKKKKKILNPKAKTHGYKNLSNSHSTFLHIVFFFFFASLSLFSGGYIFLNCSVPTNHIFQHMKGE